MVAFEWRPEGGTKNDQEGVMLQGRALQYELTVRGNILRAFGEQVGSTEFAVFVLKLLSN